MNTPHTLGVGWAEVLLHRQVPVKVGSLDDVKETDYRQEGSPVPLKEVDYLYDVLLMALRGGLSGLSRPFGHGDALQIVTHHSTRLFLVVELATFKATATGGRYRVQAPEGAPYGLVPLNQKFSSFWRKQRQNHETE